MPDNNIETTDKHATTTEKTSSADRVEESSIFGTLGKYGKEAMEETRAAINAARQFVEDHKKDLVIGVLPGAAPVEAGKAVVEKVVEHAKDHMPDYAKHIKDNPVTSAAEMLLCPPLFVLDAEKRANVAAGAKAAATAAAEAAMLGVGGMLGGAMGMAAAEAVKMATAKK